MQDRDPRRGAASRPDGRPPFGLGPIARVPAAPGTRPGSSATPDRPVLSAQAAQAAVSQAAFAQGSAGTPIGSGPRGTADRRPAVGFPIGRGAALGSMRVFGAPNLRRNVCPHFFVTGAGGAIPINAPHLLKGLVRQDRTISRCQLRGGVHLEGGYVNDVCLSPRFNQCIFYEEELSER